MKMTVDQFKKFAADIAPAVSVLLLARVHAEMERKRVDAYITPIFEAAGFTYGQIMRPVEMIGQPLTDKRDLYLVDDGPELLAFYDACDRAHREHGFTGPKGHCPALIAENLVITAERDLIDLAAPAFGINRDLLYGDAKDRFLELLIGASVKTGKVTNPLKKASRG